MRFGAVAGAASERTSVRALDGPTLTERRCAPPVRHSDVLAEPSARKGAPVTADQVIAESALLSLCAILPSFDRELLAALGGHGEEELGSLLTGELVTPVDAPPSAGTYRLREE